MPFTNLSNNNNNNNHHHRFNRNPNGGGDRHYHQRRSNFDDRSNGGGHDRKRPFPFPARGDIDSGGYAKLYVAPVPLRVTEDDILSLFKKHGNVVELVFVKDKCTGKPKGFCFVKYASLEEAERAIAALDGQYTLPGEWNPIEVRFANGKRERLTYFACESESLYVAELNKLATEKEIEEIFSPYGRIEDIMILRDGMNQSRGLGFVKFSHKDMAVAAISALHGTYIMRGCEQPLIVRFANPKRKKVGESWSDTAFQCSGSSLQIHDSGGIRPESNQVDATAEHMQLNAGRKMSPQNSDSSSPVYDFASHSVSKSDAAHVSTTVTFRASLTEISSCSQLLPLEKPLDPSLQSLPSLHQQTHVPSQLLTSPAPEQQLDKLQKPTSVDPCNKELPSTHLSGFNGHMLVPQLYAPEGTLSTAAKQIPLNLQTEGVAASETEQLCDASVQKLPEESSNQLDQVISQSQGAPDKYAKQQSSSNCNIQPTVARAPTGPSQVAISFTPSSRRCTVATIPICEWSEHTCPDGFKYYYNCITKESRWEQPEELTMFKQRQQKLSSRNVRAQYRVQSSVSSTDFVSCSHSSSMSSDASKSFVQQKLQPQPNSLQEQRK